MTDNTKPEYGGATQCKAGHMAGKAKELWTTKPASAEADRPFDWLWNEIRGKDLESTHPVKVESLMVLVSLYQGALGNLKYFEAETWKLRKQKARMEALEAWAKKAYDIISYEWGNSETPQAEHWKAYDNLPKAEGER